MLNPSPARIALVIVIDYHPPEQQTADNADNADQGQSPQITQIPCPSFFFVFIVFDIVIFIDRLRRTLGRAACGLRLTAYGLLPTRPLPGALPARGAVVGQPVSPIS